MSEHPLRLFSGTANRPLAEEVAKCLGLTLGSCTTTHLPDTEIHVQINQAVRGEDIFIIQPCSAPVNEHLMELLLYVDAFRRASAHSITAVIPYFPYARQERMTRGREAISAKVVATMLEALGVSRVLFVDVHAPAIQGFFNIPVDPLSAVPILAEQFQTDEFRNAAIVAPDVGRAKLAGKYAEILGLPLVVMHKRRDSFESAHATHVVGDIKGKIPIVIDDLIASGSVLTQLPALVEAGAEPRIYLAITHPVLLPTALKRLDDPLIAKLVVTDTIYVPPEKRHPKLQIVSIAPLLADVIERIHHGRSISALLRLT
ncbi:MAG TPA: ribose-phosphate diphosphokinase [Caldilineae bacterium]|jgi:ribose-phosphate pyrophosphokinase|nr:ribose-phosphate diphosphokinase [Caldilineae bacterium]